MTPIQSPRGAVGAGAASTVRGGGRAKAGGTAFRLPGDSEATAATEEAGAAGAAAPVGLSLLSLQEGEGPTIAERDARARRRGEALLAELRHLQSDLLTGQVDPARLERLAALAEGEAAADPALQEIVAHIALRARLEVARLAAERERSPK